MATSRSELARNRDCHCCGTIDACYALYLADVGYSTSSRPVDKDEPVGERTLGECRALHARAADREYLQILHHAAQTMECDVVCALEQLRREGRTPRLSRVLGACPNGAPMSVPDVAPLTVELREYDALPKGKGAAA
jgi:hypothetical protein